MNEIKRVVNEDYKNAIISQGNLVQCIYGETGTVPVERLN